MWKAQYPSTFGKVQFSKLSNLSFAYLHRFLHFISFCLYLYREAERKITAGLYVGEGSENRPFSYTKYTFKSPEPRIIGLLDGRLFVSVIILTLLSVEQLGQIDFVGSA
jgi:hypothetical protein